MRRVLLPLGVLCALLAVLTACDPASPNTGAATSTTSATTITATATATTPRLMPSSVPTGWQIYEGPHFAIAYPPGWTTRSNADAGGPPNGSNVVYGFTSPSGGSVAVNEQDGWDATTIQKDFCPQQGTPVTVGNLTWHYYTAEGGVLRNWGFVTDKGTVYGMDTSDGNAAQPVQQQDAAVLATFHAEYTTAGCK